MTHQFHRVLSFEIVSDYVLRVDFDDGSTQTIDFRPVLRGEVLSSLQNLKLFNQVQIDPEVKTLVWPNGADFDPNVLHDWPKRIDSMVKAVEKWELVAA